MIIIYDRQLLALHAWDLVQVSIQLLIQSENRLLEPVTEEV